MRTPTCEASGTGRGPDGAAVGREGLGEVGSPRWLQDIREVRMFGSQVLEIALGLTFTYLAFSLVCSGLSEYYSAMLGRRSNFLQHSIAFLFNKDNPRG